MKISGKHLQDQDDKLHVQDFNITKA